MSDSVWQSTWNSPADYRPQLAIDKARIVGAVWPPDIAQLSGSIRETLVRYVGQYRSYQAKSMTASAGSLLSHQPQCHALSLYMVTMIPLNQHATGRHCFGGNEPVMHLASGSVDIEVIRGNASARSKDKILDENINLTTKRPGRSMPV